MIIDLSSYTDLNLSYENVCKEKSNKLLSELNKINIKMTTKHNYIIIPMVIYNILEHNDSFISEVYSPKDEDLVLVGAIEEFKCYLDIYLNPNEIIISWDKQTSRSVKLNSILNGYCEKEKRVEIIN